MKITRYQTLLSICFLLLIGQAFGQNLSDITFGTDATFDVITWNIEWFPKNGSATIDSVSKIIESLDADLIGLQEIDDTTVCRQMIDNLPGYELFMDNVWFGGLAYVYKTSSIDVQAIYKIYDTSPFWNIFPRSPLVIELTFMGESFVVINNHYKCCGDGVLEMGNLSDEEFRRYRANLLLKQYIDANFLNDRVILLGDLNDLITDSSPNNVFQMFLDDPTNYLFADQDIASGSVADWSFPNWPSHLDHILITNELFAEFSDEDSGIQTIKVDNFMSGGFSSYDFYVSDHRPVGMNIKVMPPVSNSTEIAEPSIHVYPNPTDRQMFVDLKQLTGEITLKISDLRGKTIHTIRCQGNQLVEFNFEGPAGMYLLSAESEHLKSVVKWIKN